MLHQSLTHTLTNTGLLSRRDVSVDEALSIQSSSSSVLLRALDLDRNNDEVSSLIKKLNDATVTTDAFTLDRDVLIAAHGGTNFPWLPEQESTRLYGLNITDTRTQAWEKVKCPPPETSPHQFMESVWPQAQSMCLDAQQKHGQLPPNPLVKMGLGACVWLDHRIRVPFELDGRDQVLALSLSDNADAIAELVCSIIGPDDPNSCFGLISNKIKQVQKETSKSRGV